MQRIVFSLDDFTISHNRFHFLLALKNHFPDFKVSLFTIPVDTKMDYGPYLLRKEFLKDIKKHLKWIQLIPHGLTHKSNKEIRDLDYNTFKNITIPAIDKAFKDDGLPYVKGFKAPHHAWNESVIKALDDLDWFGVSKRGRGDRTKKFFEDTHSLAEPFWNSPLDVVKVNGHLWGCKDDLGLCFDNLLKLPKDTKFDFITSHIQ